MNFFSYPKEDKSESSLNEVVVVKAKLNGKDFMGGDVAKAVKNLPADILEIIQIENKLTLNLALQIHFQFLQTANLTLLKLTRLKWQLNINTDAAPKIRAEVFLTASITDWSKFNFLPGEANVFFEGTYVSKSRINTSITLDTLNLSLGIDKSILITRTSEKDLTDKPSLSSNKKKHATG